TYLGTAKLDAALQTLVETRYQKLLKDAGTEMDEVVKNAAEAVFAAKVTIKDLNEKRRLEIEAAVKTVTADVKTYLGTAKLDAALQTLVETRYQKLLKDAGTEMDEVVKNAAEAVFAAKVTIKDLNEKRRLEIEAATKTVTADVKTYLGTAKLDAALQTLVETRYQKLLKDAGTEMDEVVKNAAEAVFAAKVTIKELNEKRRLEIEAAVKTVTADVKTYLGTAKLDAAL